MWPMPRLCLIALLAVTAGALFTEESEETSKLLGKSIFKQTFKTRYYKTYESKTFFRNGTTKLPIKKAKDGRYYYKIGGRTYYVNYWKYSSMKPSTIKTTRRLFSYRRYIILNQIFSI